MFKRKYTFQRTKESQSSSRVLNNRETFVTNYVVYECVKGDGCGELADRLIYY